MSKSLEKNLFSVLLVWIGRRLCDYSDLNSFMMEMGSGLVSPCIVPRDKLLFPEFGSGWHDHNQTSDKVEEMIREIQQAAQWCAQKKRKMATVIITTGAAAEEVWFPEIEYQAGKNDNRVYTLIPASEFNLRFDSMGIEEIRKSPYSSDELRAQELGALHLYYNTDAPTAGSRRIISMIGRIMGRDLPGKTFPDYSFEELKQMAWHISRESFNNFGGPDWAIEKYPIVNGKPVFNVQAPRRH